MADVRNRTGIGLAFPQPVEMASKTPSTHQFALEGKRILIVEDEAVISMLVETELLNAGANILGPAFSVAEALRLIELAAGDGGISAAVLDLNLDGEPVWLVAHALEELGVPFLFETGYSPGCPRGGYDAIPILHKPYDPKALIGAVEQLVVKHH